MAFYSQVWDCWIKGYMHFTFNSIPKMFSKMTSSSYFYLQSVRYLNVCRYKFCLIFDRPVTLKCYCFLHLYFLASEFEHPFHKYIGHLDVLFCFIYNNFLFISFKFLYIQIFYSFLGL